MRLPAPAQLDRERRCSTTRPSRAPTPQSLSHAEAAQARRRNGRQELYTVAVCGDEPLDAPRQLALLTHGLEVRRWIAQIERARTGHAPHRSRTPSSSCSSRATGVDRDGASRAPGLLARARADRPRLVDEAPAPAAGVPRRRSCCCACGGVSPGGDGDAWRARGRSRSRTARATSASVLAAVAAQRSNGRSRSWSSTPGRATALPRSHERMAHGDRDRPGGVRARADPQPGGRALPASVIAFLTQDATPAADTGSQRSSPRSTPSTKSASPSDRTFRGRGHSPMSRASWRSSSAPFTRQRELSGSTSGRARRPGDRLLLERQLAPSCATAGRRYASATSPMPRTRPLRATRWPPGGAKAYVPGAARPACARLPVRRSSCAAISTSTAACARPSGHVEPVRVRTLVPHRTPAKVRGDLRYMRRQGVRRQRLAAGRHALRPPPRRGARSPRRSARAHDRLPRRLARRLSLEGRGAGDGRAGSPSGAAPTDPYGSLHESSPLPRAPAPLAPPSPHDGQTPLCTSRG